MRKNRFASFSVAAATTILTLGGAGCGDLRDLAGDVLSSKGGGSGGSTGSTGSTGQGCDYEGKTFPLGSSFGSIDGCNVCTCDKTGVACTEKACSGPSTPPPAQSCEKMAVAGPADACVPFDQWKIQSVDLCAQRGASLNALDFGAPCEDGVSSKQIVVVCCTATPANDVACTESVGADGAPCTVCTDASGMVVKTDCRDK
jgi:hypothetical protein